MLCSIHHFDFFQGLSIQLSFFETISSKRSVNWGSTNLNPDQPEIQNFLNSFASPRYSNSISATSTACIASIKIPINCVLLVKVFPTKPSTILCPAFYIRKAMSASICYYCCFSATFSLTFCHNYRTFSMH